MGHNGGNSSASPTAVPHTNSRVFSTYPFPPSFFFSSSRNRSLALRSPSLSSSYLLAASLSPSSSFCRLTFRTCISTNPSLCITHIRVTPVSPNANRNSVGRIINEKIVPQGGISNVKFDPRRLWRIAKNIDIYWQILGSESV